MPENDATPAINILDFPCTDVGNAELLIALNPDEKFGAETDTLADYDALQARWWRLAIESARFRGKQAAGIKYVYTLPSREIPVAEQTPDMGKEIWRQKKWALKSESYTRLDHTVGLAIILAGKAERNEQAVKPEDAMGHVWTQYLNHPDVDVRYMAARYGTDGNRDILLHDLDRSVRLAVAQYGNDGHRTALIDDFHWTVRQAVAMFGNDGHRFILLNDPQSSVRKAAQGELKERTDNG